MRSREDESRVRPDQPLSINKKKRRSRDEPKEKDGYKDREREKVERFVVWFGLV